MNCRSCQRENRADARFSLGGGSATSCGPSGRSACDREARHGHTVEYGNPKRDVAVRSEVVRCRPRPPIASNRGSSSGVAGCRRGVRVSVLVRQSGSGLPGGVLC
jgi:hypothetical protein